MASQLFGGLAQIVIRYQINIASFFANNKSFLVQTSSNNPYVFLLYLPIIVVIFTTTIWPFLKAKYQNKLNPRPLRL